VLLYKPAHLWLVAVYRRLLKPTEINQSARNTITLCLANWDMYTRVKTVKWLGDSKSRRTKRAAINCYEFNPLGRTVLAQCYEEVTLESFTFWKNRCGKRLEGCFDQGLSDQSQQCCWCWVVIIARLTAAIICPLLDFNLLPRGEIGGRWSYSLPHCPGIGPAPRSGECDAFILSLSYHDPGHRKDRQWDLFILPLRYQSGLPRGQTEHDLATVQQQKNSKTHWDVFGVISR